MPRKPREEALLKNLPPARQEALWDYLEGEGEEKGHSYRETIAWLAADGISTTKSLLSKWRQFYWLQLRFQSCRETGKQILVEAKPDGPEPTPEEIQRAGNKVFALDALNRGDNEAWTNIQRLELAKERNSTLRRHVNRNDVTRFLEWLENKRVMEIASKPGSNADKIELIGKEMFGEDW